MCSVVFDRCPAKVDAVQLPETQYGPAYEYVSIFTTCVTWAQFLTLWLHLKCPSVSFDLVNQEWSFNIKAFDNANSEIIFCVTKFGNEDSWNEYLIMQTVLGNLTEAERP